MFSAFASVQINKKNYVDVNKKFIQYFNPIPTARQDTNLVATTVKRGAVIYQQGQVSGGATKESAADAR